MSVSSSVSHTSRMYPSDPKQSGSWCHSSIERIGASVSFGVFFAYVIPTRASGGQCRKNSIKSETVMTEFPQCIRKAMQVYHPAIYAGEQCGGGALRFGRSTSAHQYIRSQVTGSWCWPRYAFHKRAHILGERMNGG